MIKLASRINTLRYKKVDAVTSRTAPSSSTNHPAPAVQKPYDRTTHSLGQPRNLVARLKPETCCRWTTGRYVPGSNCDKVQAAQKSRKMLHFSDTTELHTCSTKHISAGRATCFVTTRVVRGRQPAALHQEAKPPGTSSSEASYVERSRLLPAAAAPGYVHSRRHTGYCRGNLPLCVQKYGCLVLVAGVVVWKRITRDPTAFFAKYLPT